MKNDDNLLDLRISIEVYQPSRGGTIGLSEKLTLPAKTFLEIAKLLGQFHDLAERIRKEQGGL